MKFKKCEKEYKQVKAEKTKAESPKYKCNTLEKYTRQNQKKEA